MHRNICVCVYVCVCVCVCVRARVHISAVLCACTQKPLWLLIEGIKGITFNPFYSN